MCTHEKIAKIRALQISTNALFRSEIALAEGLKIETRREHALAVAVDTVRAALAVSTATARACSVCGSKNLNHIISMVKTDCFAHFFN